MAPEGRLGRMLGPHLRGHLLLFDRAPGPAHDAPTGSRLLIAAVLLESVRLVATRWLLPAIPLWLFAPLLLACALLAVRFVAGVELPRIGLRRWHDWTATEKSYFVQILVLANVVFVIMLAARLRDRFSEGPAAQIFWAAFLPYLFFGFYQEVVYRGMLQNELARRWGPLAGILIANLLYTFGPLHFNYIFSPSANAVPMFAAIFVMGLFFGVLYWRSGNLWLPAIFHAIGNAYMVGSQGPNR